MNHRVVHFEIPTDNPEKVMAFFKDVFSWNFEVYGDEGYWLATTGADSAPGINGAIMKRKDPNQPLVNTIEVESIDAFAEKINAAGGRIVVPKAAVPKMGWYAYFTDPDGNIHGMWQNDPAAA